MKWHGVNPPYSCKKQNGDREKKWYRCCVIVYFKYPPASRTKASMISLALAWLWTTFLDVSHESLASLQHPWLVVRDINLMPVYISQKWEHFLNYVQKWITVRYGSQTMMKEGKDAVHRAATPSIFPYFLSGWTGKKNLWLGFSQDRILPWKWWVQTRCEIDGLQRIWRRPWIQAIYRSSAS